MKPTKLFKINSIQLIFILVIIFSLSIIYTSSCKKDTSSPPPTPVVIEPNLKWIGEKKFWRLNPQTGMLVEISPDTILYINGMGLNDSVTVLPNNVDSIWVSHRYQNDASVAVATPYIIGEKIYVKRLIIAGNSAGYVDDPSQVVYQSSIPGSLLPAQGIDTAWFGPFTLPCGMFKQELKLDTANSVKESNEGDNEVTKTIFMPSNQYFTLKKKVLIATCDHNLPPGTVVSQFEVIVPAVPPPDTFSVYVTLYTYKNGAGASDKTELNPPPVVRVGPGTTQIFDMEIKELQQHEWAPGNAHSGKITVISEDGCIIRQKSAGLFIEHPPD